MDLPLAQRLIDFRNLNFNSVRVAILQQEPVADSGAISQPRAFTDEPCSAKIIHVDEWSLRSIIGCW